MISYSNKTGQRMALVRTVLTALLVVSGIVPAFSQTSPSSNTLYEYDDAQRLTQATDGLQRLTKYNYDLLNRERSRELPSPYVGALRPTVGQEYDGLDQVSSITDPRLLVTRYTNTGLGEQPELISPDTGTTKRTFDSNGNLKTQRDAQGNVVTYSYDAANRMTRQAPNVGTAVVFEYDGGAAGAPNAKGHLTKITDESGQTLYTYTELGRVASKTQTVTAGGMSLVQKLSYAYGTTGSATGKVSSMTYPSGNRVNYRYDDFGRLYMITINPVNASGTGTNTGVEYTLLKNVEYTADGLVKGWEWGTSTVVSPDGYNRSFDLDGRVVSYNLGNPAGTGSVRTLAWDAANRIKTYTHVSNGAGTNAALLDQAFEYDDLDRLRSFMANGTAQAYDYDANGNRTTATFSGTKYTNTIATASNRLDATTGPGPAKSIIHDLNGNLTNDGTVVYTYNALGRMSSATVGTAKTAYLYNGLGQRVRQVTGTAGDPAGLLAYDEAGHIIGEYNSASGRAGKEFVYLGDIPVGVLEQVVTDQVHATNVYYVYSDHLNTPRLITRSPDGKMVWRWDSSDPFGLMPPNDNPAELGVFTFNLRMPGQYFDKRTQLFYNYFRDYDPQTGRYVQSDPIGLEGGINTYSYVEGDPVGYSDPDGLVKGGLVRLLVKYFVRSPKTTIAEKRIAHIFRNKEGHLPDTPANRKLLEEIANDSKKALGKDKYGNEWCASTRPDGTQVWTQSRNGEIINGGVNSTPRSFHPQTGLSAPAPPGY